MPVDTALNLRELQRYLSRIGDRWPIEVALLGGARVDDQRGAPPQRERGPEYIVVLVSGAFSGMPWLERVYQATSLWDAMEMGDPADVHCYTPKEFGRKRDSMPVLRTVVQRGMLIYEDRIADIDNRIADIDNRIADIDNGRPEGGAGLADEGQG